MARATSAVRPSSALLAAMALLLRIAAGGRRRSDVSPSPPSPTSAASAAGAQPAVAVHVADIGSSVQTQAWVGGVAAIWFVCALAAVLWSWRGPAPRYFPSPDETVNRMAAERVAETGRPDIPLTSVDPEDLRHPRMWVTLDDRAIPAYPPAAYYLQGAMLRVPVAGDVLVAAFSAAGVAALAAGVALLGRRRRWIALAAPLMAFPAIYWLVRPWMNIGTMLAFLCFALLLWAAWERQHGRRYLVASGLLAGLAAAVRPDYAAFILLVWLLTTLARCDADERRAAVLTVVAAGSLAIVINLVLNWLTTGEPLHAAYQISDARRSDGERQGLPGPLGLVYYVALPQGVPSYGLIRDQFERYWLQMGPIVLVTVAQVSTLALLYRAGRRSAALYAGVIGLAVLFMMSRMSGEVFGGSDPEALLRHSVPRYWAPVYMLAAIPPALFVMRGRESHAWVGAVATLCVVVAPLGASELYSAQPESMTDLRQYQTAWEAQANRISPGIPQDAVVYTDRLDKVLWSRWEVASIPSPRDEAKLASSIARTVDSGRPVVVYAPTLADPDIVELNAMLAVHGLTLSDGPDDGIYRVSSRAMIDGEGASMRPPR